ncbi:MAG: hypothetical protein ACLGHY_06335, partial [Gammaproteobacteria bacterium]
MAVAATAPGLPRCAGADADSPACETRRFAPLIRLIGAVALLIWLGSGFFIVQEGHQAVVTT